MVEKCVPKSILGMWQSRKPFGRIDTKEEAERIADYRAQKNSRFLKNLEEVKPNETQYSS